MQQIVNNAIAEAIICSVFNNVDFENKHPRNKDGRFINKYSYEAQADTLKMLGITEAEFMHAVSLINTEYKQKYAKESVIEHFTPGFIYYAENHGFNNYKFFDIMINNKTIKEWEENAAD